MKNLTLLLFSFFCLRVFAQEINAPSTSDCKISGELFSPLFDYYYGNCFNAKANGYGKLFLKNGKGIYFGYFLENNLLDLGLEFYSPKDSVSIIGPNKGGKFHGPGIKINTSNQIISSVNYNEGTYVGNSPDYFKFSTPGFKLNEKFCVENLWATHDAINIPGTKKIIFANYKENNNGTVNGKVNYWISVVNLENNSIQFNFGNNSSPLKTKAYTETTPFLGFSRDNKFAYFQLSVENNSKFIKCDLNSGIHNILQILPKEIQDKVNFQKKIIESGINNFKILEQKFKVLNDSSIIAVFNNPEYATSMRSKIGGGSYLIHFNKDLSAAKKIDFPKSTICDFDVNENSGKVAISLKTLDSTFIMYYTIDEFKLLKNVYSFKNSKLGPSGSVKFSDKGTFLVFSPEKGNFIFKDDQLFFGVPGKLIGFNSNETTLLTHNFGFCFAYDLFKKTPIWQFQINEQAFCHILGNEVYFLSNQNEKKIFKLDFPDSNSVVSSFEVDVTKTIEFTETTKQKSTSASTSVESIQKSTTSNNLNKEGNSSESGKIESEYIVKFYRVNNSSKTHCKWCSKPLVCYKKNETQLKNEENTLLNNPFGKIAVAMDLWKATFEGRIIDNGNGTKTHKIPIFVYDCPEFCSLKCKHAYKVAGY